MITITLAAVDKVIEFKKQSNMGDEYFLRVKVSGGGCSGFLHDLYFDLKQSEDIEIEISGVKIIIDEVSAQYLEGTSIDYIETEYGAGFKFINPQILSTCGCGSSVSF